MEDIGIQEVLEEVPYKEALEMANMGFQDEILQETPSEEGVQMEDIEVRERSQKTQNKAAVQKMDNKVEETHDDVKAKKLRRYGKQCLRIATVFVCIVNLAYVVATAVLIGKLKGWPYSIHCFILSLFILFSFVQTVRADTKFEMKCACWISCSTLAVVLMTTFTLLSRQAYYHPSPLIKPKWVLFTLQASIIPLILNILVMYEGSIKKLCKDRFILMIAILDFADIWDMASILSQDQAPFLKEESSLEIAVQFFCSLSFSIFSLLICKNISQEGVKSMFKLAKPASEQNTVNHELVALSNSQLYQNIPFLIIRILVLQRYGVFEFDYMAKNVITVILALFDFYGFLSDKCRNYE